LTTTTLVAADPPKETVAPDTKFVPVIVTGVPPPNGPETGATADTVGGQFSVMLAVAVCVLFTGPQFTVGDVQPAGRPAVTTAVPELDALPE
jgi:hypothetical protein